MADLSVGVAELDSDMADITQSVPTESMLGGREEEEEDGGGELSPVAMDTTKLGGATLTDHELSGSGHIPSSLGINPHTLQVEPPNRPGERSSAALKGEVPFIPA